MPLGEIVLQAEPHPSGNWICVPLFVAARVRLLFVLDTGSPVSAISPFVRDELLVAGLIDGTGQPNQYVLKQLQSYGQKLPDLPVRVLFRLARIEVDGVLGLDFLRLFRRLYFDVDTFRLVLQDP